MFSKKIILFLFSVLCVTVSVAKKKKDKTPDPSAVQLLLLSDSLSQDQHDYYPISETYLMSRRKATVEDPPVLVMDKEAYQDYRLGVYRKKYFQNRFNLFNQGESYKVGPLFPGFKKFNFFDEKLKFVYRIVVEADVGVTSSTVKGGIAPKRSAFLFNTDFPIDVSLTGKMGDIVQIDLNYSTESQFSRIQDVLRASFQRPVEDIIIEETMEGTDRPAAELSKAKRHAKSKVAGTLPQDTLQLGGKQLSASMLTTDEFYDVELEKIKEQRLDYLKTLAPSRQRVVTNVNELVTGNDNIVKQIDFGSVQFPLENSLLQSSQDLFGLRVDFQFGKTTIKSVVARQSSNRKVIQTEGEDVVNNFDLTAFNYEENKHFFLAHYFKDHFETFLSNAPFISSPIYINRVEAWVLNYGSDLKGSRAIVAFTDLGESQQANIGMGGTKANVVVESTFLQPKNGANRLDPNQLGQANYLNSNVRSFSTIETGINSFETDNSVTLAEGTHYMKVRNAQQLSEKDFSFHPQLGYISLNRTLPTDAVLAVSFEYTYNGNTYRVGEFSNLFKGENEANSLIVKLLKPMIINTSQPAWDLMMKNIYSIGGWGISKDGFRLDVLYGNPSLKNYLSPINGTSLGNAADKTLLQLLNVDRLNVNNQVANDGFFDFLEGITVNPEEGTIMFPKVQPFGQHMHTILGGGTYDNPATYNSNQTAYVLRELYTQPKNTVQIDSLHKDRYVIKGKYKSSASQGISLGTYDLSRGSVNIVADGRTLAEGIDYVVNYDVGRVYVINPSLKNTPLTISTESRDLFNSQSRTFFGVDLEHNVSENFVVGGSFLRLSEKPTRKINIGNETVKNNLYGLHSEVSEEVPFITRMLNKLPFVKTDKPSVLKVRGEFAYLDPSVSYNKNVSDKPFSYIDNFEGVSSKVSIMAPLAWTLSSVPQPFQASSPTSNVEHGYTRAKLAWYQISPDFYSKSISGVTDDMISEEAARQVAVEEIFPDRDLTNFDQTTINALTLSYYPDERGPYNYNPGYLSGGTPPTASTNWAGIIRKLPEPNFEVANIQYLEFWMLDPFVDNTGNTGGNLVFDIGLLSEDILKDDAQMYENGLPKDGPNTNFTSTSDWGVYPKYSPYAYTFSSTSQGNQDNQDKGFDGLNDSEEKSTFTNFASFDDPSGDNYQFYGSVTGASSVADYYKSYNGNQGNTPYNYDPNNLAGSLHPDVEDIDKDYNMNTIESYYSYTVPLSSGMTVGSNYLNDIKTYTQTLPNGQSRTSRWLQFKIPLEEGTATNISDMRTMRHMRVYLTGFSSDISLRFSTLALVKTGWRKPTGVTNLEVKEVNLFENASRTPIPYVLPPGVSREVSIVNEADEVKSNEQSLAIDVASLGTTSSDNTRYVYKDTYLDARLYKNINMFVHAEWEPSASPSNEVSAIIRLGSDDTDNYYEIEKTLQFSSHGVTTPSDVWLNELDVPLSLLTKAKLKRISDDGSASIVERTYNATDLDSGAASDLKITIKGNPSLATVRRISLGVKNPSTTTSITDAMEIWFNELGLSDYENDGGWAAKVNVDLNFADIGKASLSVNKKTDNFGALEQQPTNVGREEVQSYAFQTNWDLGLMLPESWKLNFPLEYKVFEETATPKYDAYNTDLELSDRLAIETDGDRKDAVEEQSVRHQTKHSISIPELSKGKSDNAKDRIYNLSNFKVGYLYTTSSYRDYEIKDKKNKTLNTSLAYNYKFKDRRFTPFKNSKLFKSDGLKFIRDFNLGLLPSSFTMTTNIDRKFNKQQFRQVEFDTPVDNTYYQLDYKTGWFYSIGYDPFKSVRVTYTGTRENYLDNTQVDSTKGVHADLLEFGRPRNQEHITNLTYQIPFDKFPMLSFIKSNYNYKGSSSWNQVSPSYESVVAPSDGKTYNLGNTVESKQEHSITASISPYAVIQQKKAKAKREARRKGIFRRDFRQQQQKSKKSIGSFMVNALSKVKLIKGTYQESRSTSLPGFLPSVNFLGFNDTDFLFGMGLNQDIEHSMAREGLLTNYPDLSDPLKRERNKSFNGAISIAPTKDVLISLDQRWSHSFGTAESFVVTDNEFKSQSIYKTGNFSSTDIFLKTSIFKSMSGYTNLFETFKNNRLSIANELAKSHYGHTNFGRTADGYPVGFGANSSEVLSHTFLSTYRGGSGTLNTFFRNIPLPNWHITIKNLQKIGNLESSLSSLVFSHGYKASYTISNYNNNLLVGQTDSDGNIIPDLAIHNMTISEQYAPLAQLTARFKNSIQFGIGYTTGREVTLNLDNNSLLENLNSGILLNFGYKVKNAFGTRNPLNITTDISFRKAKRIFRDFNTEDGNVLSGTRFITLNARANYDMSKTYTFIFYVDYSGEQFETAYVTTKTAFSFGGKIRATFF